MREVEQDPAAELKKAQESRDRSERKKESARRRAKLSYDRRKAANKGSSVQTSAPQPEIAPDPAAPSASIKESPLLQAEQERVQAAPAERELTPEEQAILAVLNTPDGFAGFLAQQQRLAKRIVTAGKRPSPRLGRVIDALGWGEENGAASADCVQGVTLAWPWLQAEGFAILALIGPRLMAVIGACVLFGPAIITALDELEEHKLERVQRRTAAARPEAEAPKLVRVAPEKPAGQAGEGFN